MSGAVGTGRVGTPKNFELAFFFSPHFRKTCFYIVSVETERGPYEAVGPLATANVASMDNMALTLTLRTKIIFALLLLIFLFILANEIVFIHNSDKNLTS